VIVAPPRVEPPPEPRKADIVERPVEPPKKAPPKVEPPPKPVEPPKKIEPPKKADPPKKAGPDPEQLKREAEAKAAQAAAEKRQQAAVERAMAAAGGSAGGAPGGSPAAGPGGVARGYESKVVGCIRQWIYFPVPEGLAPRQHVAEFEVKLLPSGEQIGEPKKLRASGLAAYDRAVETAIKRCEFPPPPEGSLTLRLTFDPVETR
jgi:colicin import membrane protein